MHFEKVTYDAFKNDMMAFRPMNFMGGEVDKAYESIELPKRKTKYSAGYDIRTPIDIVIPPHEIRRIPTGVKVAFQEDELGAWFLAMFVRSSVGNRNVVICHGTGIIDADYQFSDNDGDMLIALINHSDQLVKYSAGDRICQGVFLIHGITDDDRAEGARTGGLGSTGLR